MKRFKPGYYVNASEAVSPNLFSETYVGSDPKARYATMREMILYGGEFDREKVYQEKLAWSHEDGEVFYATEAEDMAELFNVALANGCEPGDTIQVCNQGQLDPRWVIDGESAVEAAIDNLYDDDQFAWIVNEGDWLSRIPRDATKKLTEQFSQVFCRWLDEEDLWPDGFWCKDHRLVKIPK